MTIAKIIIVHGKNTVYKIDGIASEKDTNCKIFISNVVQKIHEYITELTMAYVKAKAHNVIFSSIFIYFCQRVE